MAKNQSKEEKLTPAKLRKLQEKQQEQEKFTDINLKYEIALLSELRYSGTTESKKYFNRLKKVEAKLISAEERFEKKWKELPSYELAGTEPNTKTLTRLAIIDRDIKKIQGKIDAFYTKMQAIAVSDNEADLFKKEADRLGAERLDLEIEYLKKAEKHYGN